MRRKFHKSSLADFATQQMSGFRDRKNDLTTSISRHQNLTHIGDLVGKFDPNCELCRKLKARQDKCS